jgi:HEAT repeats
MRRAIGRLAQVIILAGAALAVGKVGATLGATRANERLVILPFPVGATQAVPERQGMDAPRVRALLDAARGANAVACELAAAAVDGHSWSSGGMDGSFRAGGSGDSVARDVATWIHHDVDPAAVPLLRTAIADSDWCVRRLAAPLLGRVRDASAMQAMQAALGASDAGTREMAALALGFAEDARTIPQLVSRLRDDAPRVRATTAWALGEIDRREAARPLIDALGDSDALVRESAARALGEVEDPSAIPPLTDLLKSDRAATVRRAAAWALGEIIG